MVVNSKEFGRHWWAVAPTSSPTARVVCEATGGVTATHEVVVARGPDTLLVKGPKAMKKDHVGEFLCLPQPSSIHPAPSLTWRVRVGSHSQELQGTADGMLRVSAARIAREFGDGPSLVKHFAVEGLASHPEILDRIAVEHVVKVFCK